MYLQHVLGSPEPDPSDRARAARTSKKPRGRAAVCESAVLTWITLMDMLCDPDARQDYVTYTLSRFQQALK